MIKNDSEWQIKNFSTLRYVNFPTNALGNRNNMQCVKRTLVGQTVSKTGKTDLPCPTWIKSKMHSTPGHRCTAVPTPVVHTADITIIITTFQHTFTLVHIRLSKFRLDCLGNISFFNIFTVLSIYITTFSVTVWVGSKFSVHIWPYRCFPLIPGCSRYTGTIKRHVLPTDISASRTWPHIPYSRTFLTGVLHVIFYQIVPTANETYCPGGAPIPVSIS